MCKKHTAEKGIPRENKPTGQPYTGAQQTMAKRKVQVSQSESQKSFYLFRGWRDGSAPAALQS